MIASYNFMRSKIYFEVFVNAPYNEKVSSLVNDWEGPSESKRCSVAQLGVLRRASGRRNAPARRAA